MPFLGDFGRAFNLETKEALEIALATVAGGPSAGATQAGKAVRTPLPSGDPTMIDVAPRPSGVDSPASLSNISQTSMVRSQQPMRQQGASGDFLEAFGGANLFGNLLGGALKLIPKAPTTKLLPGLIGGGVVGAVVDTFFDSNGTEKKLVITRALQRIIKKLFMLSGGDFELTAQLYFQATGKQISGEQVVKIITKTFKNQGPYVTKAAVRKTRATIRKMETLCDLKDRLCPPKRRAPARRRTMSTSITQVK